MKVRIRSLCKTLGKKLMSIKPRNKNWIVHYKDGKKSPLPHTKKDALSFMKTFGGLYIENVKTEKRLPREKRGVSLDFTITFWSIMILLAILFHIVRLITSSL